MNASANCGAVFIYNMLPVMTNTQKNSISLYNLAYEPHMKCDSDIKRRLKHEPTDYIRIFN